MTLTRRQVTKGTVALALSTLAGRPTAGQDSQSGGVTMTPELILVNGRITTLDRANPEAEAIAIARRHASSLSAASATCAPSPVRRRNSSTLGAAASFPASSTATCTSSAAA